MNRLILRLLLSLQLLLFFSVLLLEWSSQKYMTMMRIVLFRNRRLETLLPMDLLVVAGKTALAVLAAAAAYVLIRRLLRGMTLRNPYTFQLALLALTAGGSAVYMTVNSTATFRTYYYSSVLLLLLCLIQLSAVLIFNENRTRGSDSR